MVSGCSLLYRWCATPFRSCSPSQPVAITASRARPADGSVAAGTAAQASIVRALEGLTLEVERLSEAQRCAGRLLVEGRQARDAAGVTEIGRPPERVVTPR